jgi:hypothetical protein
LDIVIQRQGCGWLRRFHNYKAPGKNQGQPETADSNVMRLWKQERLVLAD